MLHSIGQQIWKTHQWSLDWKRSVFISIPKKGNAKNVQTTIQLCSFHMLARLCSKSFKLDFSSLWTENFQMYRLRKGRGIKSQIAIFLTYFTLYNGLQFHPSLWEKARVGCFEGTALKHVYYLGWNRSPAQAGCMRQVLGPGALRRPRGIGWRGR